MRYNFNSVLQGLYGNVWKHFWFLQFQGSWGRSGCCYWLQQIKAKYAAKHSIRHRTDPCYHSLLKPQPPKLVQGINGAKAEKLSSTVRSADICNVLHIKKHTGRSSKNLIMTCLYKETSKLENASMPTNSHCDCDCDSLSIFQSLIASLHYNGT